MCNSLVEQWKGAADQLHDLFYVRFCVTLEMLEIYERVAIVKRQSNGAPELKFPWRIYRIHQPLYNINPGACVFHTLTPSPLLLQPLLHLHSSSFFSSWPPTTPR